MADNQQRICLFILVQRFLWRQNILKMFSVYKWN